MSTGLTGSEPGLVAYYRFDEPSGDAALDSTSKGNNGVLGGSNPANAPARVAGIVIGPTLTFTPPDYGAYTIALSATDHQGWTGDTIESFFVNPVAPSPSINLPSYGGRPGTNIPTPEGTPVTLIASAYDPSPSATAAGFDYVWSVSAGTKGQQVVAGQNLTFNGADPIALPAGLIHDATSLNITVTFQTTGSGVILGYQNQALGSTPTEFVPLLYVGSDGYLHGELFDGTVAPIPSFAAVNDGQAHTAMLNWYGGNTVTLTVDGVLWGETKVAPQMLDMTFDELGTGYTTSWPATPGGYFPFTGTISSITITSGLNGALAGTSSLAGTVALTGSAGTNQISFTPPDTGPYTIGLSATDKNGLTGIQTTTISPTELTPTLSVPSTQSATQGKYFYLTGSFTDASGDGPWTIAVNFGDGSAIGYAEAGQVGSTSFSFGSNGHKYSNAGMFNAQVRFTNADGVTLEATVQVSVSGFTVNDGNPQQSIVKSLTYTFANPTQVEPGAFELLRNRKRSNVDLIVTPLSDGMTYLITFSGSGVVGGSLPDGNYTLVTLHNLVNVLSGPPMTQDDVNTFVRLFSDADGDGKVNATDKALLKQAEANPASPYARDFEFDGKPVIDKIDISQFNERYNGKLDPPKKAPAKFPGRTVRRHVAAHRKG
jgi:hypothetical protein